MSYYKICKHFSCYPEGQREEKGNFYSFPKLCKATKSKPRMKIDRNSNTST